jgi:hypothetical protein
MAEQGQAGHLGILGHQSLRRALTDSERRLADALEAVFASGRHEFSEVAEELQRQGIARPSGVTGPWTVETLEYELKRINDSLDRAYHHQPGEADQRI